MQKNDQYKKDLKKQEDAKHELQRYMFYFERYDGHRKAEKHARNLMPNIDHKIKMLHDLKSYPAQELKFLTEACLIVQQARAVLKWTYGYGYYEMGVKCKNPNDKFLFETW